MVAGDKILIQNCLIGTLNQWLRLHLSMQRVQVPDPRFGKLKPYVSANSQKKTKSQYCNQFQRFLNGPYQKNLFKNHLIKMGIGGLRISRSPTGPCRKEVFAASSFSTLSVVDHATSARVM